jgi:hypothetical protein
MMTAQEAYELANRKSRYGHRDWLVWKGRNGQYHAELTTRDSFKAALLAVGTQGRFTLCGSDGVRYYMTWPVAITWRRSLKHIA